MKWEEKGGYIESGRAEDVEARKLKHLTTKPCPKCGVRIEKSGGCPVRHFFFCVCILYMCVCTIILLSP